MCSGALLEELLTLALSRLREQYLADEAGLDGIELC